MTQSTREPMVMLTCRVPRADLTILETLANSYGLTRSEALRKAYRQVAIDRGLTPEAGNDRQGESHDEA